MIKYYSNKTVFLKIGLSLVCWLAVVNNACAQTLNPDLYKWTFTLGLGLNSNSVIDKNFSQLPYSGNGLGLSGSITYQGRLIQQQLNLTYGMATLQNKYYNSLYATYFTANYSPLFCLNNASNSAFKILAGPQIAMQYARRNYSGFVNNNSSFEFSTSLATSIEISYSIIPIGLVLKNKIAVPVFSYMQQPAFGFATFFANSGSQNSVKNSSDFLVPNKFYRIINNFTIDKQLAPRHKILLSYNLDFYKINTIREVKSIHNNLIVAYSYLL